MNLILSELQEEAMEKLRKIQSQFGNERWISHPELVGVHRNTLRSLESKGLIENWKDEGKESIYYRIKVLPEPSSDILQVKE